MISLMESLCKNREVDELIKLIEVLCNERNIYMDYFYVSPSLLWDVSNDPVKYHVCSHSDEKILTIMKKIIDFIDSLPPILCNMYDFCNAMRKFHPRQLIPPNFTLDEAAHYYVEVFKSALNVS